MIPFAAAQSDARVLLILMSCILTFRFISLLKIRNSLGCFIFVRDLVNKVIWAAYHSLFVILWVFNKESYTFYWRCGIGILLCLFCGIASELLFIFIDIVTQLIKILKKCLRSRRAVHPESQSRRKTTKRKNTKKVTKQNLASIRGA